MDIEHLAKEDCFVNVDTTTIEQNHTPTIHLKTIDNIRLEMAKVYRDMRSQKIPTHDGTRLVYVLAQIGKMIELFYIEKRLEKLETKSETRK
jgi:hypothetical protein